MNTDPIKITFARSGVAVSYEINPRKADEWRLYKLFKSALQTIQQKENETEIEYLDSDDTGEDDASAALGGEDQPAKRGRGRPRRTHDPV